MCSRLNHGLINIPKANKSTLAYIENFISSLRRTFTADLLERINKKWNAWRHICPASKKIFSPCWRAHARRKFIESCSDGTIRFRKWLETSSTFNFSPRDDLSITAVDRGATSGFHIVPNDSYPSGKFRFPIPLALFLSLTTRKLSTKYKRALKAEDWTAEERMRS